MEYPVCAACGSEDVLRDAYAVWNREKGEWVLLDTYDSYDCNECNATRIRWVDWIDGNPADTTKGA